MRNKNEKRVIREWRGQPTRGRDIDLPAIFRRWTSKSSALATGSSQGSVLDRLVNVWMLHRRRRVSQKGSFRGRCQTCLSKSNKIRKGTVNKTSCSKVCMDGQWSMSERMMVQRVLGRWAVYLIGETNHTTKGNYRGYPTWVHVLFKFSFLTDGVMVVWFFSTNPRPGDDITPSREVSHKKGVTHCLTFIACSSTWNTEDWLMSKTSRLMRHCTSIGNHLCCFSRNALSPWQVAGCDAWDLTVTEMHHDRMAAYTWRWPAMKSSGEAQPVSQDKLLSPLPLTLGPPIVREWY